MENLISVFVEEAKELLQDLEGALLELETNHENREGIGEVFRIMHSLKGTASMFGFEAMSNLTHGLETIYQSIREGEFGLTPQIFGTTLQCLDHLRDVLNDSTLKDPALVKRNEQLTDAVSSLMQAKRNHVSLKHNDAGKNPKTFYVHFNPDKEILKRGTNTLFLVDDLLSLGEGLSLPYFIDLPDFAGLEGDLSFTGFEILLCTEKDERDIRDIFVFVEDDCDLEIEKLSDANILTTAARQHLFSQHALTERLGLDHIRAILVRSDSTPGRVPTASPKAPGASSIRVSSERLDELMNLVSELVTTQASLTLLADNEDSTAVKAVAENVEKITRRLRDNAFTMTLVPVEALVVRFQRLVRDVSEDLGKKIEFRTEGTETEIDKAIIEKLTDPLLHLLRNALDHGIESADVRIRNGKTGHGTISFKSYYEGANVIISIKDDGAGIDPDRIRRKAVSKGLISADAVLTPKEVLDLIFLPGFSTAEQVTEVSGRGVGMDVVRRNITEIRGEVDISSEVGKGTTFTIRLPLTLSIIDGLLVRIGNTDFIVPLFSVEKCYEVPTDVLENAFNNWVTLDGTRIPFFFLRDNFSIPDNRPQHSQIIKISYNGDFVGLAVDKIIGNYQAVLKPLGLLYKDQEEFLGATILGDGTVALVIDSSKLILKLSESFAAGTRRLELAR